MKTPISLLCLLSSCTLCLAENPIPNGDFENMPGAGRCVLGNSIRTDVLSGWRCFTTVVEDSAVAFEVVDAGGTKALMIEMISNPGGGTGGSPGIDLDHRKLPVTAGARLHLKFKAKLSGEKPCAIMVTMAGHRADGSVVSQSTEVFDLESALADYEFPEWTVPEGASDLNVVFNLVESASRVCRPLEPCGFVIDDIVLETAK